ncbi:hypothetical protein, partial [Nocardia farcinica]|uniref:hypothetical protein n=1 Tax=Nocardia farcinica TaxID=37329 RepID=UPI001E4D1233
MATLLKALLQQRHLQTVSAFNREYDRIARRIDPHIVGSGPKKAQFYRWLSGSIAGLPYPHHRRVLTEMFPGWSMEELFAPYTGGIGDLARNRAESAGSTNNDAPGDRVIVHGSRVDFLRAMPPQELFAAANSIDLMGISSNSQILWIGSRQATSDTGVSGEGSGVMSTGRSRSLPLWNTAP